MVGSWGCGFWGGAGWYISEGGLSLVGRQRTVWLVGLVCKIGWQWDIWLVGMVGNIWFSGCGVLVGLEMVGGWGCGFLV